MKLMKIMVRWNSDERQKLIDLDIPITNNANLWVYKPMVFNLDNIVMIGEYEKYCTLFVAGDESSYITNIPYHLLELVFGKLVEVDWTKVNQLAKHNEWIESSIDTVLKVFEKIEDESSPSPKPVNYYAVITPSTHLFNVWVRDTGRKIYGLSNPKFIKVSCLQDVKGEFTDVFMGYEADEVSEAVKEFAKSKIKK